MIATPTSASAPRRPGPSGGEDCYILKVAVRDTGHLEALIERRGDLGRTHTSIVLSSPLLSRPILPIPAPAGGTPAATLGT